MNKINRGRTGGLRRRCRKVERCAAIRRERARARLPIASRSNNCPGSIASSSSLRIVIFRLCARARARCCSAIVIALLTRPDLCWLYLSVMTAARLSLSLSRSRVIASVKRFANKNYVVKEAVF